MVGKSSTNKLYPQLCIYMLGAMIITFLGFKCLCEPWESLKALGPSACRMGWNSGSPMVQGGLWASGLLDVSKQTTSSPSLLVYPRTLLTVPAADWGPGLTRLQASGADLAPLGPWAWTARSSRS